MVAVMTVLIVMRVLVMVIVTRMARMGVFFVVARRVIVFHGGWLADFLARAERTAEIPESEDKRGVVIVAAASRAAMTKAVFTTAGLAVLFLGDHEGRSGVHPCRRT